MLLNSVMIVSQEIFEVALMVSLIISIALFCQAQYAWIVSGALLGLGGAWLFAVYLQNLSILWEYRGQEAFIATVYLAMYAALVALLAIVTKTDNHQRCALHSKSEVVINMLLATLVALALVREIGEIIVYILTYQAVNPANDSILLGTMLGVGIGSSFAVILFFMFTQLSRPTQRKVILIWSGMIAGVLAIKSATLLSQIGLLADGAALWDSSNLIAEQSIVGHIASALVGYDPQPTAPQLIAFVAGISIYSVTLWLARGSQPSP